MAPIRVGIVGAGIMGRNHARVLSGVPEATLAGVYDLDPRLAHGVASTHAVPLYPTLAALLGGVDAVIVATPTVTHHDVAMQALESGKHVLIEKPMASTQKEAEALRLAAQKADKILAIGHVERHNPAVAFANDALASGDLGELIHLGARRVSNLPGRIRDVGVVFDLGIHDIDVIRYLARSEVASVFAITGRSTPGIEFEDHAMIILKFRSGITGSIETNWLTPLKVRRLSLTASRSYVEVDYMDQRATIASSDFRDLNLGDLYQAPLELHQRVVQLKKQEPLALELRDFLSAVSGERSHPLVTADDGIAALRVAQAAVRSGAEGRPIALD